MQVIPLLNRKQGQRLRALQENDLDYHLQAMAGKSQYPLSEEPLSHTSANALAEIWVEPRPQSSRSREDCGLFYFKGGNYHEQTS